MKELKEIIEQRNEADKKLIALDSRIYDKKRELTKKILSGEMKTEKFSYDDYAKHNYRDKFTFAKDMFNRGRFPAKPEDKVVALRAIMDCQGLAEGNAKQVYDGFVKNAVEKVLSKAGQIGNTVVKETICSR